MTKWQPILGLTALALVASTALCQLVQEPEQPLPPPPSAPPIPPVQLAPAIPIQIRGVNGGVVIINGQPNGQIIVNGGIIIINGPVNAGGNTWPQETVELSIVNTGFANDQDVQGSIDPLVSALRSSHFGEREDASLALLRLPPERLNDVVAALSRATDAESIERLTLAAAHLFLKPRTLLKTRASVLGLWHQQPNLSLLGLKYRLDPVKLQPGDDAPTMTVQVTDIEPGFPATQTLRNGDRIVAMGGVGFPPELPLTDGTYFRSRVAHLWPGSVVQMLILRDGKVIDLGVQVSGLPWDGAASPDVMVASRRAALSAFLETLKTGEHSQAMNTSVQPPILPPQATIPVMGQ